MRKASTSFLASSRAKISLVNLGKNTLKNSTYNIYFSVASMVPGLFINCHWSPVLVRHGQDGCEGGEGDVDVGGTVRVEEEPAPVRQHLIHLGQHPFFSLLEAGAAGLGGQVQYL